MPLILLMQKSRLFHDVTRIVITGVAKKKDFVITVSVSMTSSSCWNSTD